VKWATRRGINIDRAACARLIRRHIDTAAEFVFVADPAGVPADATAFDMRGVELAHHGGTAALRRSCARYDLTDPVLCGSPPSSTK
jgi:hypothetical protein